MSSMISFLQEVLLPPSSKFQVEDIPDLTGKIAIVTGGNSGIGYQTVKCLLEHNAQVYLATRNKDKATSAIENLKAETGGKEATFLPLDLSSLKNIKSSVEQFRAKENKLHILINNAAVYKSPIDDVTTEGIDLQFGTNALGHFYFTKLLLPVLEATVSSSSPGDVRVVNVASAGIFLWDQKDLAWDTLKDGPARRKMDPESLYNQSKVANVLLANEFARRYGGTGIISSALNPAAITTNLYQHVPNFAQSIGKYLVHAPSQGALTSLWAATSEEGRQFNGKYLKPWATIGKATPLCENEQIAKALWDWCEDQVAKVS